MNAEAEGVSMHEAIEALLTNPLTYLLGAELPPLQNERGGRKRHYHGYMYLFYVGMISQCRSARRTSTELKHRIVWKQVRRLVKRQFPDQPEMWPPKRKPMRRYHWIYGRDAFLANPNLSPVLRRLFTEETARQTVEEMGLLVPHPGRSLTHPDPTSIIVADGKVISPMQGGERLDKRTGELKDHCDPNADVHHTGTGEAFGNKYVIAAVRGHDPHTRMILDFDVVERVGAEMEVAEEMLARTKARLPGADAVAFDGALRGKHSQKLMRESGLLSISPPVAASGGRGRGPRIEKQSRVEKGHVKHPDGTKTPVDVYAHGGQIGLGEYDERGELRFEPLERIRTTKHRNHDGTYRFYNEYRVTGPRPGTLRVGLVENKADAKRGYKRAENVRWIPPGDPDYARLYGLRSDIESINRHLDDTCWLGRAHSVGHARQMVDLLGFSLLNNSISLHRRRQALAPPGQLAA